MSILLRRMAAIVATLSIGLAFAPSAWAGPEWDQDLTGPDAGALPGDAQVVQGSLTDPVTFIQGELEGNFGPGPSDFQDMYLIQIVTPSTFFARTIDSTTPNGFTDFDTQLWLFDTAGLGLLGNDNSASITTLSELTSVPSDGSPALVTPGFYYLAISGAGSAPVSGGGSIFSFGTPTELSGPDGPGGLSAISGWDLPGATGRYTIELRGVNFAPAPGALAVLAMGFLGSRRRRR